MSLSCRGATTNFSYNYVTQCRPSPIHWYRYHWILPSHLNSVLLADEHFVLEDFNFIWTLFGLYFGSVYVGYFERAKLA